MRNINISEKRDQKIQQGESGFKYLVLFFLAACWLCRNTDLELLPVVQVQKYHVAAVGNLPVQDKSDPLGCGDHWPCVLGWHL